MTYYFGFLPLLKSDISVSVISLQLSAFWFSECPYGGYLAGAFGATVYNPFFLIVKNSAVLPAHVFLFSVLHPPKGLLHDCVLLCLNIQQQFAVRQKISQK